MTPTLLLGDCLEEMDKVETGSVDAIICDLPYGQTACKWDVVIPFEPLWKQFKRVLKKRGAVVLFGASPFNYLLWASNPTWFKYEWIWDKYTPTGFLNVKKRPLKSHENILVFSEKQTTYNPQKFLKPYVKDPDKPHRTGNGFTKAGQPKPHKGGYRDINLVHYSGYRDAYSYPKSIIQYRNGNPWDKSKLFHPTQKPVPLLEYLVLTYTNPGELVLDCVMGSGTTGEACVNTGRRFIGIELMEEYYKVAEARIANALKEHQQQPCLPEFLPENGTCGIGL